jgi:hypothetical protein
MARQTNGTNQGLQSATLSLGAPSKLALAYWLWWDAFASASDVAVEYGPEWNIEASAGLLSTPDYTDGTFVNGCGDTVGISLRTFVRPSAANWHHYVHNFDLALSSEDYINSYIDGSLASLTTLFTTNPTSTFGNKALNLMCRNNTSLFGAGRIAEVAIWAGVNLDATEASNLAGGTLPTSIQAGSLKHYWKLCGTSSPEPDSVGSASMTVNGATFVAHPSAVSGSCGTPITGQGRKHQGFNYWPAGR